MYKKVIAGLILASLCTSVFAAGFLGPPTAGLKKGQWGTGYNYSYSSQGLDRATVKWRELDWDDDEMLTDTYHWSSELKLRSVNVNRHYWNINYGVRDWWELYFQLGLADVKANAKEVEDDGDISKWGMNFDNDICFGWGTKFTFYKGEKVSWGTALQMNWLDTQWGGKGSDAGDVWKDTVDLKTWDLLLSIGPTVDMGGWKLYGGPFYYYLAGDYDYTEKGSWDYGEGDSGTWRDKGHANLEASHFGGFLGAQFDISKNTSATVEYSFTGDGWAVGTGILIKLN